MSHFAARQSKGIASTNAPVRPGRARRTSALGPPASSNQAMQHLLDSGIIQPKMTVNPANDRFEQEANHAANTVMGMTETTQPNIPRSSESLSAIQTKPNLDGHESFVQRQEDEEESVQTKPISGHVSSGLQRQEEEEESVQTKSLAGNISSNSPQLQRKQDEEESVQMKSLSGQLSSVIQRQDEEEESVQTKSLASNTIQRQDDGEEESVQTKPSTVSTSTLQRQNDEEESESVQTRREGRNTPDVSPELESAINSSRGGGSPLDSETRSFFEPRFGSDFSNVRIHNDSAAANSARQLNAEAFTRGSDIYFGSGRYQPNSPSGRHLLAHELTHTIQQGAAPSRTSADSNSVHSKRSSTSPTRNDQPSTTGAAQPVQSSAPPSNNGQANSIARQETATGGEANSAAPEEISIDGSSTFSPPSSVERWLEERGNEGDVTVRLGNLARGTIHIRKRRDQWETRSPRDQSIPFTHPFLEPLRGAEIQPVLAITIQNSNITGYASIARGRSFVKRPTALINAIKEHGDMLGWVGLDLNRFPSTTNSLENGVLNLRVSNFTFSLGGYIDGTGEFGLANSTVTFGAQANIHVQGLTDATLSINRNEEGSISGSVEVPVSIAKFSGNLNANYEDGVIDIRGTVGYNDEKFSGEVTLLVTDAATARNVALEQLGPEAVMAAAEQTNDSGGGGRRARRGERAIAGWGTLTFSFTEWLTGQAQVIIDNEGHITVIGEITPQAEVELFPQRDIIRNLFTFEVRARYGVPLVGNLFLFANIGMDALAKMGPGKIYNIAVRGRYSTDPRVFNEFTVEATLNISAFAGLRMRAEGGAGIEIAGHDLKAGVGINALAGVRGFVEATPVIGYREQAAPQEGKAGEFFFNGHMELAAQPFLGLSGDLFVELDSPWWSPAPDKTWTWPIGSLEYPLPGEFGIGADVDYVIGSNEWPEIQFGEVDFNADKFMTDLVNDHVPQGSQGEQEQDGQWQEGQTTGAATDPTLADSQGAPSADQPAGGRQDSSDGAVPAEGQQQQWQQGLAALGRLAEESQADALTREELDERLSRTKNQYGFSRLRVEEVGEDFSVFPSMSPEAPRPVRIEGEPYDRAEVELARNAFGTELFSSRRLAEVLGKSQATARRRIQLWIAEGILFSLASSPTDPLRQYSFDREKAGQRETSPNNRSKYGYSNPSKTSSVGLRILSKGLRPDSPEVVEPDSAAYHQQKARYSSQRQGGSPYQNFGFADAILGHREPGASGHWNSIGHTQPKSANQRWNRDPNNYWGPEHRTESASSGSQSQRYLVPSRDRDPPSHSSWL